jgi:hypothetical protein
VHARLFYRPRQYQINSGIGSIVPKPGRIYSMMAQRCVVVCTKPRDIYMMAIITTVRKTGRNSFMMANRRDGC